MRSTLLISYLFRCSLVLGRTPMDRLRVEPERIHEHDPADRHEGSVNERRTAAGLEPWRNTLNAGCGLVAAGE